jgi:hypothetical protein
MNAVIPDGELKQQAKKIPAPPAIGESAEGIATQKTLNGKLKAGSGMFF